MRRRKIIKGQDAGRSEFFKEKVLPTGRTEPKKNLLPPGIAKVQGCAVVDSNVAGDGRRGSMSPTIEGEMESLLLQKVEEDHQILQPARHGFVYNSTSYRLLGSRTGEEMSSVRPSGRVRRFVLRAPRPRTTLFSCRCSFLLRARLRPLSVGLSQRTCTPDLYVESKTRPPRRGMI